MKKKYQFIISLDESKTHKNERKCLENCLVFAVGSKEELIRHENNLLNDYISGTQTKVSVRVRVTFYYLLLLLIFL